MTSARRSRISARFPPALRWILMAVQKKRTSSVGIGVLGLEARDAACALVEQIDRRDGARRHRGEDAPEEAPGPEPGGGPTDRGAGGSHEREIAGRGLVTGLRGEPRQALRKAGVTEGPGQPSQGIRFGAEDVRPRARCSGVLEALADRALGLGDPPNSDDEDQEEREDE